MDWRSSKEKDLWWIKAHGGLPHELHAVHLKRLTRELRTHFLCTKMDRYWKHPLKKWMCIYLQCIQRMIFMVIIVGFLKITEYMADFHSTRRVRFYHYPALKHVQLCQRESFVWKHAFEKTNKETNIIRSCVGIERLRLLVGVKCLHAVIALNRI